MDTRNRISHWECSLSAHSEASIPSCVERRIPLKYAVKQVVGYILVGAVIRLALVYGWKRNSIEKTSLAQGYPVSAAGRDDARGVRTEISMKKASRIAWGYATNADGDAIIRNWYVIAAFAMALLVGTLFLNEVSVNHDLLGAFFLVPALLYVSWAFYVEICGVRVAPSFIDYPVRLGIDAGVFPLFRRRLETAEIAQGSSQRGPGSVYKVYLSGEFGQAKLVFDTKGGRDRLFAIIQTRYPKIRIFRWS